MSQPLCHNRDTPVLPNANEVKSQGFGIGDKCQKKGWVSFHAFSSK